MYHVDDRCREWWNMYDKALGDDRQFTRFDFGLTFSAGVMLFKHYYAGISYDVGCVNVYWNHVSQLEAGISGYARTGNFSITVGYNF